MRFVLTLLAASLCIIGVSAALAGDAARADGAWHIDIDLDGSLQNPVLAPGGNQLLFTRFRTGYNRGPSDLFIHDIASGVTRALVSDGSSNVNMPGASWNKATGQIVFSSTRGDHDEIFVIPASGGPGDARQVTRRNDVQAFEPSLSPDGRWLVFESHEIDAEAGRVTKTPLEGRGPYVDLTAQSALIKQPNWSPVGDLILYQERKGDAWAIYVIPAAGGVARRVTPPGISATDAVFSPDGRMIYFSGEGAEIPLANLFRVPTEGGAVERLTSGAGYDGAVSVSADNRTIVFESAPVPPDRSGGTGLWWLALP